MKKSKIIFLAISSMSLMLFTSCDKSDDMAVDNSLKNSTPSDSLIDVRGIGGTGGGGGGGMDNDDFDD